MKSLSAIVNQAAPGLAACLLLLPWTAGVEAAEPVTVYTETKLTAADGAAGDVFATSVAISGNTVVIGASSDADSGINSGSTYVFERDPSSVTGWTQTAKLTASDGGAGDHFGFAVAISADTLVVGAHEGDFFNQGAGAAYVFDRDPVDHRVWTQTAKLTAADGAAGDVFGTSVAISGDIVLIGAPADDDAYPESGSAYVFERDADSSVWTQVAKLRAADPGIGDDFGFSVALSGSTALIGSPDDDDRFSGSGSAYVFERDDAGIWTQTAKLLASDGFISDSFGFAVAVSSDTAVIGAEADDDPGLHSGSAYVFERDPHGRDWIEIVKINASDGARGDHFGRSVAVYGDALAIGADRNDGRGDDFGSAYIFERDPDDALSWVQTAKLVASDGAPLDYFGNSIAISEDAAIIGAFLDDDLGPESGSAYVYARLRCEVRLRLEPASLRPGEELEVAIDLLHRRPFIVTVPFQLWVEDGAGRVVVERTSRPITIRPGDRLQPRLAVTLPPGMPPGTYRVLVGVRRMQQGIAWSSQHFEVVE